MSRSRLFLAADPREFNGFLRHCRDVRVAELPVNWARLATFQGRPAVAIANGAGWKRAAGAITDPVYSMICSVGFCGALDPSMKIGDIFVASHVNGEQVNQPRTSQAAHVGALLSTNRVAQTSAEKKALRDSGGVAVEMEAAGAMRRARELGIPFYCVRAVSDLADENFTLDYNSVLRDDGRFDLLKLVGSALLRPFTGIPELMRLNTRASLAAKNLGDFLFNCEF